MKKELLPEPQPNNEPLLIDATSSPNCTKPNVICSQILETAIYNFITYSNSLTFKAWLLIFKNNLTGLNGFYEWFVQTYKPKPKHFAIVSKMDNGFFIDMSQLRLVYFSFFKETHTNIKDNDLMDNVIAINGEREICKGNLPLTKIDEIIIDKIKSFQNFSSSLK